jgi:hypothetical protein
VSTMPKKCQYDQDGQALSKNANPIIWWNTARQCQSCQGSTRLFKNDLFLIEKLTDPKFNQNTAVLLQPTFLHKP